MMCNAIFYFSQSSIWFRSITHRHLGTILLFLYFDHVYHLKWSRCKRVAFVVFFEGRQMGYRLMTKTLHLKYGLKIPRHHTMKILRAIDPIGIQLRQRRVLRRRTYTALGPNYLWHADGHDKLKRFGFAIHACIDGYSRRIIWVKCSSTNNDPSVIAYYYLSAVKKLGFCARTLRTDCGTENGIMASIQCGLRNTLRAHIYGKSQHNQRIESWWSYLRKMRTQWWIEFFADMEQAGLLNIDCDDHVECLRYCFMDLIRNDLQCFFTCHLKNFLVAFRPHSFHTLYRTCGCPLHDHRMDKTFLLLKK